jgi:hypothetical protein
MSTNIAMSGNGITFPQPGNEEQVQTFQERIKGIAQNADVDRPPVNNPNLNMAPFTRGDPHFTQQPVLAGEDGRPDASTLMWDKSKSSRTVSPSSLAWTQTKGVTWAKNFEQHFDILPESIAPKFRSQVLTTMAQLGTKFALVDGNLRANEEDLTLVSGFTPGQGVTDDSVQLNHHSAMLWFLSDLVSLAENGWFGYVNPEPLIPVENLQKLADAMGGTTMNRFSPDSLSSASTRDVGQLLGAVGWYGTHAGSDEMAGKAAQYANGLAETIESNLDGNGLVANGAENQAATQGIVGQGLVWASQIDAVDHSSTAESVLGYLFEELFDDDAGTFASGTDANTYRITTRDAGDITGGVNTANAVLGMDVTDQYARFFNRTLNRGRLQRAERPPSRDENAEFTLPLPPAAGGEFGQAAVYNQAVEYDTSSQEWSVVDDAFVTADALYLANQELWVSQWGGSFFEGRGVPGQTDAPPQ